MRNRQVGSITATHTEIYKYLAPETYPYWAPMTHSARLPRRRNRVDWTAYERSSDGVGFDWDACSDRTSPSLWPGVVEDVEDLTMLHNLGSVASESDVR